eukprot:GHVS01086504.1.p1 GENE.GHVS01086504.1~~GHVS01086504.1.p1  ORF type:complete len:140 (+),score=22.94 GHVS01086504.1:85-504(+)
MSSNPSNPSVITKDFTCSLCSFSCRVDYFGTLPPFDIHNVVYLEKVFAVRSPFPLTASEQQAIRSNDNKTKIANSTAHTSIATGVSGSSGCVCVGGVCSVCAIHVCMSCSLFYCRRFCSKCVATNKQLQQSLPSEVVKT